MTDDTENQRRLLTEAVETIRELTAEIAARDAKLAELQISYDARSQHLREMVSKLHDAVETHHIGKIGDALEDVVIAALKERTDALAEIAAICAVTALSSNPMDYVAASVQIEALARVP